MAEAPSITTPKNEITAAGAIVTRNGGQEVLLVHRPQYDDWSWPKGKQDPGEHITTTAVREVLEETGLRVRLGRPLPRQWYGVGEGRSKTVFYWVAYVRGSQDVARFVPNEEIDQVRWVNHEEARDLLTYDDDRDLLASFAEDLTKTRALVVLRHAKALSRSNWGDQPDLDRPLTAYGHAQAEHLPPVLAAYAPRQLMSSPAVRCLDTVQPAAALLGLPVSIVPGLGEENEHLAALEYAITSAVEARRGAVLCSHRPVLPRLLAQLDVVEEPLAPGELVVCHHRYGTVIATERYLPS